MFHVKQHNYKVSESKSIICDCIKEITVKVTLQSTNKHYIKQYRKKL